MNLALFLFLIGTLGFILNRRNLILMIISIEIMLLAVTILILISSFTFDDNIGQTFSIYIISIAGAESVIGLSILVAYYRLNRSLLSYYLSYSYKSFVKIVNKISIGIINYSFNKTPIGIINYSTINKTIGIRNYSTINKFQSIDPWFISGIFDAESSFVVTILKNPRYSTGWNIQARVQIKMHEIDRVLIEKISKFFGGIGYISKPSNNSTVEFRVSTLTDIVNVIIPHFDKYPLITKKHADYILFKQIINLMVNKEHNTLDGIQKIINIRASLNTGLSEKLKEAFTKTIPSQRLENSNLPQGNKINPEWMAGFCTGESNFFITVQKSKSKIGFNTSLRFSIAQHSKELLLLESFSTFFNCGYVVSYKNRLICEFIVTKIDHILEYIIPFFIKHPILGSKYFNSLDFNSAAEIIKNKEHLNSNGLEKILQLKNKITTQYKNKTINNHR
jgi:NADH:ubiquinone oxidoreductase subunit K